MYLKITIFRLTFTKKKIKSKRIFAAQHKEEQWAHCNFTGMNQHCISNNYCPKTLSK